MPDDRSITAIARIEHALARIESAAAKPGPANDEELAELREVHQSLRSKVEDAVAQLDRLLQEGGRG